MSSVRSVALGRLLRLALRRLQSRLGLSLLALLSVVLAVALVAGVPIFVQGVSYLVLREELGQLSDTFHRPPLTMRFYFVTRQTQALSTTTINELGSRLGGLVTSRMGLPIAQAMTYISSPSLTLQPTSAETLYRDTDDGVIEKDLHLSAVTDVEPYIEILEGAPFGTVEDTDRIPTWPYQLLANELGLQVGEAYDLVDLSTGNRIPITIAGIWRPADPAYFYWSGTTILWDKVFLVPPELYEQQIEPTLPRKSGFTAWYFVPDADALTLARADAAAAGLPLLPSLADRLFPGVTMDVSPDWPLRQYLQRKAGLGALLTGFSLPALALLCYFMWLLAGITAQSQREEVAILAGRGTSQRFLLGLALIETLLLLLVGTPVGLGLALLLARGMGQSAGFLTFAQRSELPATLLETEWRLLLIALAILMAARLIPTMQAARVGIVHHLRARSRPRRLAGLVKLAIDLPLVALTYYAYQQLTQRGTIGIIGWEPGGDPFQDPLLILTPSLFVFSAALLLTHLFPLLMQPIDRLGGKLKSFPIHMGLRRLHRQRGDYDGALFLIMVCLSLGAFYGSMARSLDQWLAARIYYQIGADYRFRQGIPPPAMGGPSGAEEAIDPEVVSAWLLPVSDYLALPGVERVTRVGEFAAKPAIPGRPESRFMGIDRLDFPAVVYYRADFSQAPLGELMNRLGMYPNGLLVSSHFLARHRMVEGQQLTLEVTFNYEPVELAFLIVGVYDYFPTVYPADEEVFVGNLDYLFEQAGDETQHQIWLRTQADAVPTAMMDAVIGMGVWPVQQADARARLLLDEERVERIGLFGVLSVGFLVTAVLACLGLLLYTYASLQGRLQQNSVLRAIGIKTSQVLTMTSIEYLGVVLYGVLWGTLLGIATAYLFVPFFRVSGDPTFALPPFVRHIAWDNIGWLTLTFTLALVVAQGIILWGTTRRDLFQLLRMGQRE